MVVGIAVAKEGDGRDCVVSERARSNQLTISRFGRIAQRVDACADVGVVGKLGVALLPGSAVQSRRADAEIALQFRYELVRDIVVVADARAQLRRQSCD